MPRILRATGADDFAAMLEIGVDPGEAFFAIGVSYEALRKQLLRRGRDDLVGVLRDWKAQDAERVKHAQGRSWW